jgi:hypothetical protein
MGLSMPDSAYSATVRFLVLHNNKADGGLVVRGLDLLVHGGQVEIQLTRMFRLEGRGLQFHDHVALEPRVIEKQVSEELIAFDLQPELTPHEGESRCPVPAGIW